MRLSTHVFVLSALALTAAPVHADAISEALDAASAAYATGDLSAAAAQITTAGKEVAAMQSALLAAFFPPAPEGWTRSDNGDLAQGLSMMGGGAAAESTYESADGMSITLSAFADNIMVQSFAGVLASPQMMAMMGKTVEVNGVPFLVQDGQMMMGLLENRVLVQASGEAVKAQELLGQIDLSAMATFDRK